MACGPNRAPARYDAPASYGAPTITTSAARNASRSVRSQRGTPRNVTSGPYMPAIAAPLLPVRRGHFRPRGVTFWPVACGSDRSYVPRMHTVDATTEQMIRSVLAYAENRLRLDPVPLDHGSQDPAALDAVTRDLLGDDGHNPDEVLGVYASMLAPAVISADSPRFLGFIPAAPTKAALLFDMLVSCASIQGISWLEAAGAIHAENQVLALIADRAGMPAAAGGCFVSGGSAANLSALVVAREVAKRKAGPAAAGRRWRVAASEGAHSSIANTLRTCEMAPLAVRSDDHPL